MKPVTPKKFLAFIIGVFFAGMVLYSIADTADLWPEAEDNRTVAD